MNKPIRFRFLSALAYLVMGSVLLPVCLAQDSGGQSQPQQGQGQGGQPGGGRPQPSSQPPDRTNNPPSQFPDTAPRPIFLSGSVRLTDGTVPPDTVVIERVCNGRVRPEGYTDSKGNFSFQVGAQPGIAFADASIGNTSPFDGFGSSDVGVGPQGNVSPRELTGCEIRANLAGFQSSTIMLTFRQALDDPDIGVIHLRRLANVEGFTFSITTGSAPKDARNAYEKGLGNAKKQKWSDAERDFLKAVQVYPKYAVAWYELGRIYQQEKKLDDAARAQNEAIKIDPKFINPYGQLALLAAVQNKWEDVVLHSSQVLKLNPDATPDVYFYSAVANYNLQKLDIAKDHARQAATRDTQHRNPRINHLLGVILAQTQEYKEAGENLRLYLKLAPKAPDAADVNQMLGEIDKALGAQPATP
jgi:tetratricopeptide (TPR) repeat protein